MRKYGIFIAVVSFVFIQNVKAAETYYTSQNNVSFTQEEYDFLSSFFWDGVQDEMTQSDYQKFIASDIMYGDIEIKTYTPITTLSTTISDGYKTLKISKSCSSTCYINVTATWTEDPSVRSYDVIGAYLKNTELLNTPVTTVRSSSGTSTSSEIQNFSNGFGVSIKLPTSGSSIIVSQTFKVSTGGTVYASYQHATSSISLANSKNYTISSSGYGGVFNFTGTAASVYDRMNGVSIAV